MLVYYKKKIQQISNFNWIDFFTGMVEMLTENIMYLNLPNNPDKVKLFADQIYVTQVSQ